MKIIVIIITVLIPAFVLVGFAYSQGAPDGFLGFKWGSNIELYGSLRDPPPEILNSNPLADFKDKYTDLVDKKDTRLGRRFLGRIGEVDVETTMYFFRRNRFCEALTVFTGERNYRVLKDALVLKYGRPMEDIVDGCRWKFISVWIELEYDGVGRRGNLRYTYIPIVLEGIKEERKDAEKTKDAL